MSIHGLLHFHVGNTVAVSPLRAPFGSVEISPDVTSAVLDHFLEFAETRLEQAGVMKIVIRNPPDAYQPAAAKILRHIFSRRGYTISTSEITSIIEVSSKTFDTVVHPRKKRKLKQANTLPFQFLRLEGSSLREVYEFIARCRMEKKYKLSITLGDLQRMVDQFPDNYHIFAVYYMNELVAASVAIQVNDHVLYHFISDHLRKIGSFSPALVLMDGIYNFCLDRGLPLLDLGTSAPDGVSNSRLLNFKNELGSKDADKITVMKTLR